MEKTTLSIEQSLESIAIRLDELTGNGMSGNSYLKLDEPVELDGVENELEKLNDKVDRLADAVETLSDNLASISTISDTLENMLGWYIEFNKQNKK